MNFLIVNHRGRNFLLSEYQSELFLIVMLEQFYAVQSFDCNQYADVVDRNTINIYKTHPWSKFE